MTIKEETHGDVVVIAIAGNFMGEPEVSMFQEMKFQLIRNKKSKIVLDLGELKVANSSGLGIIIGTMISARKAGGDLRLARAIGEVGRVVTTMGLTKVFKVYDSVEQAIESFKTT